MSKTADPMLSINERIFELETQLKYGTLSDVDSELLTVLKTCYELLARTQIYKEQTLPIEGGSEQPLYISSGIDTLDETLFRFATSKGEISFRKLLTSLIHKQQLGPNKLTKLKISKATNVSQDAMTKYFHNKSSMNSDNIEKIINYIHKTNQ